jgi:hypothetical protein
MHSVFNESTLNSDIDEIERLLKCKICDVGLCIFGCFKKYHTKARFSYWTRGVKPIYTSSRYLQKMYVYGILLYLKINI